MSSTTIHHRSRNSNRDEERSWTKKRKNISVKTGEHGRSREGGKLRTTPRRKEDSDWMHDLGGKNRFSKLSYVEQTAVALSAQWQTIPFPPSCPLPLLPFLARAGNSESDSTMTTSGSRKGSEYTVPGICPFHLPRDIFGSGRTNRKAAGSYIAFISRDELRRSSSRVPHRQSFFLGFFHWLASLAARGPGKTFSCWISKRRTLCARVPVHGIWVPSPSSPFRFHSYCRSSHCASYEWICETVCNELPDRKLFRDWSNLWISGSFSL